MTDFVRPERTPIANLTKTSPHRSRASGVLEPNERCTVRHLNRVEGTHKQVFFLFSSFGPFETTVNPPNLGRNTTQSFGSRTEELLRLEAQMLKQRTRQSSRGRFTRSSSRKITVQRSRSYVARSR